MGIYREHEAPIDTGDLAPQMSAREMRRVWRLEAVLNTASSPHQMRSSDHLQRRMDSLPELSRELPPPSNLMQGAMFAQTRELRIQIIQLRESIRRHQAQDARARARAAPWLEADQQLHSDDPTEPISALHELRLPLAYLAALLQGIETDFRDIEPTPRDVEELFRASVRARYADYPLENPQHDLAHLGWDETTIAEWWDIELARRLQSDESTPIGAAAQQLHAMRPSSPPIPSISDTDYWGHFRTGQQQIRDSLSPSASTSSGGPVSLSHSHSSGQDLEGPFPNRSWEDSRQLFEGRRGYHGPPLSPTFSPPTESHPPTPARRRLPPVVWPGRRHPYSSRVRQTRHHSRSAPRIVQSPPSYISAGGIDGLGDRELSLGPGEAEVEETWDIMRMTVAPDQTLPSADSSFTSAAASASFSASRINSARSSIPNIISLLGGDDCLRADMVGPD